MSEVVLIRPRRGWWELGLADLWQARGMVWNLAGREILLRYKQTFLGIAWAVVQPITTMIIFTIFFGRLAGLNQTTGEIPYPLFTFAALVPWYYFIHSLSSVSNCIIENKSLISKVYFPRFVLPLAPLVSAFVDFFLSLLMLAGLMAWYGVVPSVALVTLPLFVLFAMLTALAIGLWLAALNAHYRDFRYVIPFVLNIGFFASPIAYPSSLIRDPMWRTLYGLNPMVGVIEGFRWSLFPQSAAPDAMMWVSAGMVLLLLTGGIAFYGRVEQSIVDVV